MTEREEDGGGSDVRFGEHTIQSESAGDCINEGLSLIPFSSSLSSVSRSYETDHGVIHS